MNRLACLSLVLLLITGCGLTDVVIGRKFVLVPSESMEPTIKKDSRVTVRLTQGEYVPRRGDIVMYRVPDDWTRISPGSSVLARVIGVPGDSLECCDAPGERVVLNGKPLDEPYLSPLHPGNPKPFSVKVREDRVWLMCDYRNVSLDSRYSMDKLGGGTVGRADILGVVELPARS
ncbi:signal peptidase I [Nonomuraea sp. NPDC050404]|uniref:signal peptidase I n=1 Tax=Nonomuraea sp. NPDC050404 TaxID=3155783 RepID=UPI0033CA76B3